MNSKYKNLHLALSAAVVVAAGLFYGANPEGSIPHIFSFTVDDLELKNIFRAIMGLYLGFAAYWIIGIWNAKYWEGATISNIIFMGGIAFGRILGTVLDGFSIIWVIGLLLELFMMAWGIYNLTTLIHEKP